MSQDAKKLPPKITIAESINFVLSIDTKTNAVQSDLNKADLARNTDEIVKLVCLMASFSFISKDMMALSGKAIKTPSDYSRLKFLEPIQKYLGMIVNEEAGRLFWQNRYILEKYATPQPPEGGESKSPSGDFPPKADPPLAEGVNPHLEIVKKPN